MLLALAHFAHANDALILIRSDRINHAIKPDQYAHGTWALWPKPWDSSGANLYMSPLSGHDWKGTASDLAFKQGETGSMVALNAASLDERGYNEARRQVVGPQSPLLVLRDDGAQSAEAMLIASGYAGKVETVSKSGPFPEGQLLVYDARNWDDAGELAKRVHGRAIVLQYPPESGSNLTPFWLYRGDWPQGLPHKKTASMPGLLALRDIGTLIKTPESFNWSGPEQPKWKGAGFWFRLVQPIQDAFLLGLGMVSAVGGLLSAYFVAHERRSHLVRFLLLAAFCVIPAAGLAGYFGEARGPEILLPITLAIWALLIPLAALISWAGGRMALGWLSLFALSTVSFGNFEFSLTSSAEYLNIGAMIAAAAGVAGFSCGASVKWRTMFFFAGSLVLGVSFIRDPWWANDLSVAPVLAIVIAGAAGLTRIAWAGTTAMIVLSLAQHGFRFAFNSLGRIGRLQDAGAIDFGQHARFLTSPLVLTTLLLAGATLALGGQFLLHELKKLARADRKRVAVMRAGALTFAIGLTMPQWLMPAAVVAVSGLLLFLYDCVGEV